MKGTSNIFAKVCANNVLPVPVGPTKRIFDFEISILSFSKLDDIFYNDYKPPLKVFFLKLFDLLHNRLKIY